jgi:hypothetical protein
MKHNKTMPLTEQKSMVLHISTIMLTDFNLKMRFVNPTSVMMRLQRK